MEGKKTKGRQKIEIKLIENMEDRLVTFFKRRSGINKKASELVTLTGRPFSFGHPSADNVVRRYLGQQQEVANDGTEQIVETHRQIKINDLNNHHNQLIQKLDSDNQKMKELKASIDAGKGEHVEGWRETPIDELSFADLVNVSKAYKDIFAMISTKLHGKTAGGVSTSLAHSNPNPLPLGNTAVNHLGISEMSGPPFEVGTSNGGGVPTYRGFASNGGGGPLFEECSGSGICGPLFEAVAGNGGSGPPALGPAPSDEGHQWGSF